MAVMNLTFLRVKFKAPIRFGNPAEDDCSDSRTKKARRREPRACRQTLHEAATKTDQNPRLAERTLSHAPQVFHGTKTVKVAASPLPDQGSAEDCPKDRLAGWSRPKPREAVRFSVVENRRRPQTHAHCLRPGRRRQFTPDTNIVHELSGFICSLILRVLTRKEVVCRWHEAAILRAFRSMLDSRTAQR
jgi:hypothetical protein